MHFGGIFFKYDGWNEYLGKKLPNKKIQSCSLLIVPVLEIARLKLSKNPI
jgi:hypothetical protein